MRLKTGMDVCNQPAPPEQPSQRHLDPPGGPIDRIDVFGFSVRTPGSVGRFGFKTIQGYSDGDKVYWDGSPGTPAPALDVA